MYGRHQIVFTSGETKNNCYFEQELHPDYKERQGDSTQVTAKIKKALDFMRNQHFEVPFISFYRKEYVHGLDINDLWKIYKFDAKVGNVLLVFISLHDERRLSKLFLCSVDLFQI